MKWKRPYESDWNTYSRRRFNEMAIIAIWLWGSSWIWRTWQQAHSKTLERVGRHYILDTLVHICLLIGNYFLLTSTCLGFLSVPHSHRDMSVTIQSLNTDMSYTMIDGDKNTTHMMQAPAHCACFSKQKTHCQRRTYWILNMECSDKFVKCQRPL